MLIESSIIGTEIHSGTNIGLLAFGCEEDKRDRDGLCVSTECSEHAVAVQFRHRHIAEDQVRLFLLRQLDADSTILGGQGPKLFQKEDGGRVSDASPVRLR